MALLNSKRSHCILSAIAFELLNEAADLYRQNNKFSAELLQALHATFGSVLVRATELLESGRFVQYEPPSGLRRMLKVGSRNEQYTVFSDINFCHCEAFTYQVLHASNALTCKHVLAGKLAQICGQASVEVVTDAQFVDLLNDYCDHTAGG